MTRETREVWEKRVERWADSGMTAREFAAEIGVNQNTLASWRWRLNREAALPARRESGGVAPQFVELIAANVPTAAPEADAEREVEPLELVLVNGHRLRIPARFDPGSLRRVLAALEAR